MTLKLWPRDHINTNYERAWAESIAINEKIGYGEAVDNVLLTLEYNSD